MIELNRTRFPDKMIILAIHSLTQIDRKFQQIYFSEAIKSLKFFKGSQPYDLVEWIGTAQSFIEDPHDKTPNSHFIIYVYVYI